MANDPSGLRPAGIRSEHADKAARARFESAYRNGAGAQRFICSYCGRHQTLRQIAVCRRRYRKAQP